MVEPIALVAGAAAYMGASLLKSAADDAVNAAWVKVKAAFKREKRAEPKVDQLTSAALKEVALRNEDVMIELARLWGASDVLRRVERSRLVLNGAKVLWIDDDPEFCSFERQFLESMGCAVITRESTRTALATLSSNRFDLILSDIARSGKNREGLEALPAIKRAARGVEVIFYVAALRPSVPEGAFGITNRPDDLFHLCIDVLERKRG